MNRIIKQCIKCGSTDLDFKYEQISHVKPLRDIYRTLITVTCNGCKEILLRKYEDEIQPMTDNKDFI